MVELAERLSRIHARLSLLVERSIHENSSSYGDSPVHEHSRFDGPHRDRNRRGEDGRLERIQRALGSKKPGSSIERSPVAASGSPAGIQASTGHDGETGLACVRCGRSLRKFGHRGDGLQRFQCPACLTVICEPHQKYYFTPKQIVKLFKAWRQGLVVKEAGSASGIKSTITIRKYFAAFRQEFGDSFCPCGKNALHRGWCSYRLQKSPKRQAFLKSWHTP